MKASARRIARRALAPNVATTKAHQLVKEFSGNIYEGAADMRAKGVRKILAIVIHKSEPELCRGLAGEAAAQGEAVILFEDREAIVSSSGWLHSFAAVIDAVHGGGGQTVADRIIASTVPLEIIVLGWGNAAAISSQIDRGTTSKGGVS